MEALVDDSVGNPLQQVHSAVKSVLLGQVLLLVL